MKSLLKNKSPKNTISKSFQIPILLISSEKIGKKIFEGKYRINTIYLKIQNYTMKTQHTLMIKSQILFMLLQKRLLYYKESFY